jgi:16S rRNA processing protein RimM
MMLTTTTKTKKKQRPRARRTTTPQRSEPSAGKIVGIFGLRGECKLDATRIGSDALAPGMSVRARFASGSDRSLVVRGVRLHKGRPLVTFEGIDDATAATALVGAAIALDAADIVLGEGEYLAADLIGCSLVDSDGTMLANVVDVAHYPASDMLIVGEAHTLVPLVAAFVKRVDVGARRIDVTLPRGLLDERDADRA